MKFKWCAAALGAGLLMSAAQASAAVTLDQYDVPETGTVVPYPSGAQGSDLSSGYGLGQSFTVGVAGTLSRIDVGLFDFGQATSDTPTFEVLGPSNNVLFSTTIDPSDIPDLVLGGPGGTPHGTDWSQLLQVDVASAKIPVTVGESMRWLFLPDAGVYPNPSLLNYENAVSFPYSRGQSFLAIYGGFYNMSGNFAFRTYVDTAVLAAPEPGVWLLLMLGLGLAGGALRAQRRAVLA